MDPYIPWTGRIFQDPVMKQIRISWFKSPGLGFVWPWLNVVEVPTWMISIPLKPSKVRRERFQLFFGQLIRCYNNNRTWVGWFFNISHSRIHGTNGIFIYLPTNLPYKINHSCRQIYHSHGSYGYILGKSLAVLKKTLSPFKFDAFRS